MKKAYLTILPSDTDSEGFNKTGFPVSLESTAKIIPWLSTPLNFLGSKLTKTGINVFVSTKEPVSSKNWARNQALQQAYILYGGNHTWQKALLDYVKGNKKEAFLSTDTQPGCVMKVRWFTPLFHDLKNYATRMRNFTIDKITSS